MPPQKSSESIAKFIAGLYPKQVTVSVSANEFLANFKNGEYSPVFGEITCKGGETLFEHVDHHNRSKTPLTLVDLGSGVGRFCIHAALTRKFTSIFGIELSPSRHLIACKALEKFSDAEHVKFHNMNLLDFPLPITPLVVYCASLTFSTEMITAIEKKIKSECQSNCLIYTCRELKHLKKIDEIFVDTSWSPKATLHVYET